MSNLLQKTGNLSLQILRTLFGAVFVFSGFVKAIDPLGSTYKIEDYLRTFGGFFESLADYALPLAIALSTLELLIGLNMILRVHVNTTNLFAFLFMLVMTPLTLYIAVKNPVTDCGCFGDALIISNWTTFFKNLVLFSSIILMLVYSQKFRSFLSNKLQYFSSLFFILIGISLSVSSYLHLPMIDFLPYKIGVNIPKAMEIPDNAPKDQYQTTFIYEREGEQKEFTLNDYPKNDSSWVFVDQKSKLIKQGFRPLIHDFSIMNEQFDDITKEVLSYSGKTYLLVIYDVAEASLNGMKESEKIYQKVIKTGDKFYALTGSSDSDIKKIIKKTGVTYPFWKTDETALKSIVRANPGVVLIQNGIVLNKWNWRDFKVD
jgi:uncharacterized membrane protein YphA (DoxX/SURF4 family)